MDDLIYTLLFIGWIAYGIYSAVKKNKAKANTSPASQATPVENNSKVETVLESLFQEGSQYYSKVNSPYYASDSVEENEDSFVDISEKEEYEEPDYLDSIPKPVLESKVDTYSGTDNVQTALAKEKNEDEVKDDPIASPTEMKNKEAFVLRQAIIAQVILERPYQ